MILLNEVAYTCRVRKIALHDRLALGAAELFHKPFRQPVSTVHTPVKFVDPFIKGISASRHDGEQADDPQEAVFDFSCLQADQLYRDNRLYPWNSLWIEAALDRFWLSQGSLEKDAHRIARVVEVLVLQSLAYQGKKDINAATTTLAQAVTLAQPEGYQRVFSR